MEPVRLHHVPLGPRRGQHHARDVAQVGRVLDLAQHLEAVDLRQPQVEQDEVRAVRRVARRPLAQVRERASPSATWVSWRREPYSSSPRRTSSAWSGSSSTRRIRRPSRTSRSRHVLSPLSVQCYEQTMAVDGWRSNEYDARSARLPLTRRPPDSLPPTRGGPMLAIAPTLLAAASPARRRRAGRRSPLAHREGHRRPPRQQGAGRLRADAAARRGASRPSWWTRRRPSR